MSRELPSKTVKSRRATVMFADISGFTALGERLDPEEVIGIVNGCFERLEAIVYAHGGAIDEYLGDCVKAAFGLTLTAGDGARHAVEAALAMRDAIAQYNVDRGIEPPLGVHIGLSTGSVATVPTGSAGLNKTCVMGEAARLASALEDASERGQIFVGPETRAATERSFAYRSVEAASGHGHAPEAYELVGPIPRTDRKRESERRAATILFADLIGTDDIAADARGLEVEMGELFDGLREAAVEYGGVVNQYTGDGVMALYGIPNAIEDAPKQALNSALRIRELVRRYAAEKRVPLSVHVGVNSGFVIAGEIGGSIRKSFTGVGDTVNMSARIKEAAPPDEIYVGPETQRLVQSHFDFEPLAAMRFKGKRNPVPVYRLASQSPQIHRHRGDRDGRRIFSGLVGRDRDLATLRGMIDRVSAGTGGAVSLVADAGLGKTRLLTEALAGVDRARVIVLPARSISIGAKLAFHPFIDLLRGWASIDERDSESEALFKLERGMAVMGDAGAEALPFVATLLGLRPPGAEAERIAAMDGDAVEKLVTKSLRDLLEAIARARPTIVVMEDVHWADRSSVSLLESVLGLARTAPLLFCLVMRPEFADSGEYVLAAARRDLGDHHVEIALQPLTARDISDLIQNLLDIEDLPASVRATITEKAGGNPFFIEEVVRELVDSGAIALVEGRFRVTEGIGDVVIPSTVQEVIMVRIDRLDESKRHVLQLASVIGRSFSYRIIAELVERAQALSADLDLLRDKQILVVQGAAWEIPVGERTLIEELEYMFKHALAQETIYSSILHQTRKELHGRVASAIEARFSDRLKEFYGTLSHHYLHAAELPKAESYSFLAGEEAARAGASREALQHFRDAARLDLELHGDRGDAHHRERIEKGIGLALMNTGRLPESLPHFDRALEHLGERVPNGALAVQGKFAVDLVAVVADTFLLQGIRRRRDGSEGDREFFEILNARARASVTSDPRRIFYDNIGGVRRMNGIDPRSFEPACAMYAVAGGMFSFSGLSFGLARRFLARAQACRTASRVGDAFDCASLEFTIGYLEGRWLDEHLLAPGLIDEAIRNGLFWDVQNYLGLACDRLQRQGRFAAAEECFAKLAELRDVYEFGFAGTNHDGERAMFHLERRDLESAREAVERYLAGREEYALRVLALGTKAKILCHAGDEAGAEEALAAAEEIFDGSEVIPPWHASAHALARLQLDVDAVAAAGKAAGHDLLARARRSARKALRITRTVASQRTEALRLAGTLAWLTGRRRYARRLWSESLRFGEAIGARPELARTSLEVSTRLEPTEELAGIPPSEYRRRARETLAGLGLHWDLAALEESAPSALSA
jgi:class 3 adenylate cyclase/tetratricopeptide (TPR) repeat protein